MNKQIPNYLRLVTDISLQPPAVRNEDLAPLDSVCRAFSEALGWQLEYAAGPSPRGPSNLMWSAPVDPGVGNAPGHIRLLLPCDASRTREPRVTLDDAGLLAESIVGLWEELSSTRHALWQREAELAAGVPLVVRSDDDERQPPLGERLEAVLRGGAEAIGCQAAALYLLDSATTELKLRASWGLPRRRLTEPARPLRPALADLEALLGHAVALVEPTLFDYWKVPEEGFRAAVCVPVASPSMPLGTLWIFSEEVREFNAAETNIVEVVAGRLAADLERETLVDEAIAARDQTRQIAAAERWQQDHLPHVAPLVAPYEVAAHASFAASLGGTFYDWFALADGSLSLVAGDARQRGVEGALVASALRGAARACGSKRRRPQHFLRTANTILWSGSAGSTAGVFHAVVDPQAAALEFAVAGPMRVVALGGHAFTVLAGPTAPLGLAEGVRPPLRRHTLAAGEVLLAYGTSFASESDQALLAALDERLKLALAPRLADGATVLADLAAGVLQGSLFSEGSDRVAVAIKRQAGRVLATPSPFS